MVTHPILPDGYKLASRLSITFRTETLFLLLPQTQYNLTVQMDAMGYCLYGASALICPMLDARRQQVYTGLYRYEEKFEIVKEQCITDIHALIAELNERGERVIFLGDGVPVNRAVIEEEMKVPYSFAPAQASRQRASAVAALGAVYLAEGKTETAAEHKPDYLRKSQAEREREVAERQGEMDKLAAGIVVVEKK